MKSLNNTGDSISTHFSNIGGFGGSIAKPISSSNSVLSWILITAVWGDSGVWMDDATWFDG